MRQPWSKRTRLGLELLESRRLLSVYADFNGDSRDDLAIGAPDEDIGALDSAGAVNVIYGAVGGLSSTGSQLWTQDTAGILDVAEGGDSFGQSLAGGDFNNDGFADLAIGSPGETINGFGGAGAFHVIYGSASGLTATGNEFWHQDTANVREIAETFDNFGFSLAAGDFNGDNFADLAVGVPFEQIGGFSGTGAVQLFLSNAGGISARANQVFHQDIGFIPDSIEGSERFGFAVTAGDFNGDGLSDVAVGAPGEGIGTELSCGAINVIYGHATFGLTTEGSQIWHQDSVGVLETAEDFDEFGSSLTAGDFNDDGFADIAIGVIGEDLAPGGGNEGGVNVLYGSAAGTSDVGDQFWTQNNVGGGNVAESAEVFGSALAAGNLGGSSHDELAIGVFGQDVGAAFAAGSVNVLFGSATGLTSVGSLTYEQEDAAAVSGSLDNFGRALAIGDFNGGGLDDLAVGTPGEDVSGFNNAGAVYVFYSSGLEQTWHQDTAGIGGAAEANDAFGAALNSGNSEGSGSRSDSPGGGGDTFTDERQVSVELTTARNTRDQNPTMPDEKVAPVTKTVVAPPRSRITLMEAAPEILDPESVFDAP